MARKYTHFSYTHLTTVYNIIIHVSLVITLILCSVQSMFISPWQNSNHQWFLWWVFLMNIYCSWVAQLFLYMIPGQTKKRTSFPGLHNVWCLCRNCRRRQWKEERFSPQTLSDLKYNQCWVAIHEFPFIFPIFKTVIGYWLKHSWFTMSQVYSDSVLYIFHNQIFPLGYYKIMNIVPCAIK